MIDEYWTWIFYGYYSDELKPKSRKPIIVRCDGCCLYSVSTPYSYRDLCHPCSQKLRIGATATEETRANMSKARKGKKRPLFTDEWKHNISESHKGKNNPMYGKHHSNKSLCNMSKAQKGRIITEEARHKISETLKGTTIPYEVRCHMSAGHQGISYEEWTEFSTSGEYCEKFDEACRERIRAKYDRKCFLCYLNEEENKQKLSVHHIDMNKMQGCNNHEWNLVPLCRYCHGSAHTKMWQARIEYLLKNNIIIQ
jgi:hypothetical protein